MEEQGLTVSTANIEKLSLSLLVVTTTFLTLDSSVAWMTILDSFAWEFSNAWSLAIVSFNWSRTKRIASFFIFGWSELPVFDFRVSWLFVTPILWCSSVLSYWVWFEVCCELSITFPSWTEVSKSISVLVAWFSLRSTGVKSLFLLGCKFSSLSTWLVVSSFFSLTFSSEFSKVEFFLSALLDGFDVRSSVMERCLCFGEGDGFIQKIGIGLALNGGATVSSFIDFLDFKGLGPFKFGVNGLLKSGIFNALKGLGLRLVFNPGLGTLWSLCFPKYGEFPATVLLTFKLSFLQETPFSSCCDNCFFKNVV